MEETFNVSCKCGYKEAFADEDGSYYCRQCLEKVEGMAQTAFDEESQGIYTGNALRRRPSSIPIKAEPLSQCEPLLRNDRHDYGLNWVKDEDCRNVTEPTQPMDFEESMCLDKKGDYLRKVYVEGLQTMIELQTKALVEKFNVSPLICGIAGTIWLRYWASSGVEDDHWAEGVRKVSESQIEGDIEGYKSRSKQKSEELNIHGQNLLILWYRSLSKVIPLSHTLVITYLACHLAREAVLPTDILKWSLEGNLPFFTAFIGIPHSEKCPLSCSFMFKPSKTISLYKLESQAASVARKIGLELPPVNFYAIASRYLKRLSLDSGKILPSVSQIYEWCMPPDLWLSANEVRLPTRVCALSMVIVAIRFLYNLHGFGYWEKSFSIDLSTGKSLEGPTNTADDSTSDSLKKSRYFEKSEVEAMKILRHLEERYDELEETYAYSNDLPTYLQYCKDVVFCGMESNKNLEEEKLIEQLWNYYEKKKDSLSSNNHDCNNSSPSKRYRDDNNMNLAKKRKKTRDISSRVDNSSQQSMNVDDCQTGDIVSDKDKAMKKLKLNMEDNRFCYIPPRVKVKRRDYLQYVRKSDDGAYTYAAHADYYILLRSCAKVAKIDARVMHCGVMMLERRLGWLEKRIDYCLSRLGPEEKFCEHCRQEMECDVTDVRE